MNVDRLIAFYHALTPESVARIPDFYSRDAYFKDPFNEVRGVDAIQRIFAHMFRQVDAPRFVVTERIGDADSVMLVWELRFRFRQWRRDETQVMRGVSHVKFDEGGKVNFHRDYWDTGEELYAKLPLVGRLIRSMGRRFAA